jgi:F-type H+-transporting ATPase subunit b
MAPPVGAVPETRKVKAMSRTTIRNGFVVAMLWLTALSASAAEGGGSGGGDIFTGDLGNIVWTLVVFLLVVFVLGKFAWGPILDGLQGREEFIRNALEEAKRDRDEAKEALARYEQKIADSRGEATAIVEEGRRDAEETKKRIVEEARDAAGKERDRALRDISIARETAVKELYELSGNLAADIAGRIVGEKLDAKAHEKLIADAIQELGSTGGEAN